jgi:hypothetical protein
MAPAQPRLSMTRSNADGCPRGNVEKAKDELASRAGLTTAVAASCTCACRTRPQSLRRNLLGGRLRSATAGIQRHFESLHKRRTMMHERAKSPAIVANVHAYLKTSNSIAREETSR